ncbi:MAG: ABC transporter ATP-binding protein/permease [Ruminococcaceae bacterium]|nr:ABC transporter ATP-binding protein/permease [Oscillospiraceae bacterium]
MLELKQIKKDYPAGSGTVHALKGIDLKFRENEFVSILGPSGCGKTTMLNIIGGLDQYTEGDLVINGRSTKDYKDRDWDTYRNHSIGFVFQSYNLIPHQSVLQNVELALTLSGVSKSERRARAKKALEDVGLGDQLSKKPAEMSGGQMQRVAIARALVNNPDIILADEPTGALDTETSVQVMDILKEISKDRLIIMVTHNPDIAETYSTRIIRMLDGVITSDSAPLSDAEVEAYRKKDAALAAETKKEKKPAMSFVTSFGLSLKNLFTKKGRTLLTSFAGSIGIIGIALIYAVSQGLSTYIDTVQEDTLSSYPLTIRETHMDMGSLMESFIGAAESIQQHEKDAIYSKSAIYSLINALNRVEAIENDLASFKTFIETERSDPENALATAINGVQYTYDLDLLVYTKGVDNTVIRSDAQQMMQELIVEHLGMDMSAMITMSENAGNPMMDMMASSGMSIWQEMLPGDNGKLISPLLEKQYDVIYGSWPTQYNEIVLVVDENNELDDITLYALGLKPEAEIDAIMQAALTGGEIPTDTKKWSYEEICNMDFRVILNSDCYSLDEKSGLYVDLRESDAGLRYLYDNATVLKVSGIIRPNEDAVSAMLTGAIAYTSKLTEYVIGQSQESAAVLAQKADPMTDIFSGLPFSESTGSMTAVEKETEFKNFVNSLDEQGKAETYIAIMSIPSAEQLDAVVQQTLGSMTRADMEAAMSAAMVEQMGMGEEQIQQYITAMSDEDMTALFAQMIAEQVKTEYAAGVRAQLSAMSAQELAFALTQSLAMYTTEQCALYHDEVLSFSESTYEDNLEKLGCVDLAKPASINLFASSFEEKDQIEAAIAEYNADVDELSQIKYTDYIGLMMSSITTIINAITYVLIAFVSISLVVSSIMIGVITLISVQERTKEIGILRAIGASKRNVSRMFNAETLIIGCSSGLLGVLVTYLLCIPINAIIQGLTGLSNLSAYLPVPTALILIAISMLLTLISGIIPSRSAAKKDPVVALRTE